MPTEIFPMFHFLTLKKAYSNMEQITIDSEKYKQNKSLPDCTIKKPLERIKELAAMIAATGDETVLKNCVGLLRIEITRYDKELFNGEMPF